MIRGYPAAEFVVWSVADAYECPRHPLAGNRGAYGRRRRLRHQFFITADSRTKAGWPIDSSCLKIG